MKQIGGFKVSVCPDHGNFSGKECPNCAWHEGSIHAVAPAAAADTYDRTNWHKGPESDLHGWFETEMMRLEVEIIHSRMDVKSTIENGWPDFTCLKCGEDGITRACLIEFKATLTKVRADQVKVCGRLSKGKIPVLITGNFREAVDFVREKLNL